METIVRVQFGSHLYGTNTPLSDLDFKSIHIPSHADIVMQRVADSIKTPARRKVEGERNTPDDVDDESFALHRFFELCAKGETLALDILFAPEQSRLQTTPVWLEIMANRHRLISKKSSAFVGYCRTQANKYGIKGSRVAAAKIAAEFFRSKFEKNTTSKVSEFYSDLCAMELDCPDHMSIIPSGPTPSDPAPVPTHFECCNKQVPLSATVKTAWEIFERVYVGYGDRAKKAQDNEGIDWKALSHAVRVGNEALELLHTGKITFPLPDRGYVTSIKMGNVPFSEVSQRIETLLQLVEEAEKTSTLPDSIDRGWVDEFVYTHYRKSVIETARWRAV